VLCCVVLCCVVLCCVVFLSPVHISLVNATVAQPKNSPFVINIATVLINKKNLHPTIMASSGLCFK